jgi:hypothetical protein
MTALVRSRHKNDPVPDQTASLLDAALPSGGWRWSPPSAVGDDCDMPGPDRFDPSPTSEAGYEAARQQLRAKFARWAEHTRTDLGPDSFEELVHYKWGYLDGHLTRWTRADLDGVLLELFPAKMIADDDDLAQVIPETTAFIGFLTDTGLLDPGSEAPQLLRAHLDQLEDRFRRRMADRSRYSPGKRFWLAAAAAGIQTEDEQAVAAFIEQFNSRPLHERDALLGRGAPGTGRFTPPGTQPRSKTSSRRRRRR